VTQVHFKAIVARGKVKQANVAEIRRLLTHWQAKTLNRMKSYPPQRPTVSAYTRTGTYGRGWEPQQLPDGVAVRSMVRYATYVGGEFQTREMASRDWPKLTAVAREEWDRIDAPIRKLMGDAISFEK
jgi:hypothetical protein